MGTSAEELLLRITGDNTGGLSALKDLEGQVKSMLSSVQSSVVDGLGPFGKALEVAGVAAVAFGGTLMALGQHATEAAAELQKVALTTDIAVPAVADLKFALDATGGSLDQLNTVMFMFEQRMVNSSAKVEAGLKMIGLSLADIDGMSHDQQLLAISAAMQSSGEETNKAAVAMDIFGKQGRQILPQLMQPLTELAERSKALAGITAEAAEKAHEFEIAQKTMAAEGGRAWLELGLAVAPTTNAISLAYDRMKLAVANVALTAMDAVSGLATLGDELESLSPNAETSAAALERLAGELPKVASSLKGLADGSGMAAAGLKQWTDRVSEYTGHQTTLDEALDNEKESIRDLDSETKEHIATLEKHAAAIDALVSGLDGESKKSGDMVEAIKRVIDSHTQDADTIQRVVDQIDKLYDRGVRISDEMLTWADANRVLKGSLDTVGMGLSQVLARAPDMSQHIADLADVLAEAHENADNLASSFNAFNGGITIAGDEMNSTTIPLFTELTTGVLPQAAKAAHDFAAEIIDAPLGDAFKVWSKDLGELGNAFGQLARESSGTFGAIVDDIAQVTRSLETVTKGMETFQKGIASGDVTQEATGLASGAAGVASATSGGGAKGILGGAASGALMGAEIGSVVPVLGTAIGAVVGGIAGAVIGIARSFGASEAEKAGRTVEADFEKQFGGFDQMLDAVGQAYADTGRGASQAQADVKALMDAEKQGGAATQTMIDKINGAFADQKTKAAAVSSAVDSILSSAKTVGTNFPDAMKPLVEQLAALPGLTDDERKSLLGLTDAVKPNFADLTATAKDYGLSLTDLGPAFEQADISGRADKIMTDFGNLDKAGADSDTVLHGMGKSINTLINDAIKYGSTLPTALKPLAEQLAKTGQLTDDAGVKFDDLSGVKFDDAGDPLAKGMDSLTTALNRLGDILSPTSPTGLAAKATSTAAAIGSALASIPDKHVSIIYDRAGDSGDAPVPMAAGGMGHVTRPTLFLAGEAGAEDFAFSGGGKSFRGSGMGGGVTVNVTVEGNVWAERDLADAVAEHINDRVRAVSPLSLRRSA